MISVLIPVYNQKITKLVHTLLDQSRQDDIIIEIIAMDDGSKPSIRKHNSSLLHVFNVNYVELSENIGRSKIRNWLVKLARYDHVIFLDCDSEIKEKHFLKNYARHLPSDTIYGGRKYSDSKPRTARKMLHWKYGWKIESSQAVGRQKNPYLSFMSNNFLVSRKIIQENPFNEEVRGYGYEDLIWARSLEERNIKILHIDNPVIHRGIETTEEFLKKSYNALKNLDNAYTKGWINETKLLRTGKLLVNLRLIRLFKWWYRRKESAIIKNLHSSDPNLRNFSIWKLHQLLIIREKRKAPDRGPSQLLHY